jgi:hypothetical protein
MELSKIFEFIEEKKDKHYIMDRCLMWFLYRYKVLKWDIEEYNEMPTFFESNSSGQIKKMLKELKQMSIESSFRDLKMELMSETSIILMGKTSYGEKVRIKNKEKDLKEREMFMKEVEKDEKDFDKIKMKRDTVKELREENTILKQRIIELESNKFI